MMYSPQNLNIGESAVVDEIKKILIAAPMSVPKSFKIKKPTKNGKTCIKHFNAGFLMFLI